MPEQMQRATAPCKASTPQTPFLALTPAADQLLSESPMQLGHRGRCVTFICQCLPERVATHVTALSILAACNSLPNTFFYWRDKRWPVAWPLGAFQVGNVLLNEAACALRLPLTISFVFSRSYLLPRSSSEGLGVGLPVGESPRPELGSAF